MENFKMEGVGKINGGEFQTLKIEGVGSCPNHIKAESIEIGGVFNCTGDIDAGYLYCEGVANFKANIRVKKMVIEGVINAKAGNKIEAEEIICDGVIKTGGEIYADRITADGCIAAREIYGDDIKITSKYSVNRFINFFNREKSEVTLIEATTIELCGVSADTVNGKDITIGPNCKVDKIDCSGTLFVDRSAIVRNITGEYTMRN